MAIKRNIKVAFFGGVAAAILSSGCTLGASQSDKVLVDDVLTRIENEASFPKHIEVSAERGRVRVEGEVGNLEDRIKIETLIEDTPGVQTVESLIAIDAALNPQVIRPTRPNAPSSVIEITEAINRIQAALRKEVGLAHYHIVINKSGDTIVLSGEVESAADANRIMRVARKEADQHYLQNDIAITVVPDEHIRDEIGEVINEFPQALVRNLSFTVNQGIVKFTGSVERHADIDAVLSQTLMIDGVKMVNSEVHAAK